MIDISQSQVSVISKAVVKDWIKRTSGTNRNLTINIEGNKILCQSCLNVYFMKHIQAKGYNGIHFINRDSLECADIDLKVIQVDAEKLEWDCTDKRWSLYLSMAFSVYASLVILASLFLKYRFTILHKIALGRTINCHLRKKRTFGYHVCVGYCYDDREWVDNILLHNLDLGLNQKVLTEYTPGKREMELIKEHLECSFKMLAILSLNTLADVYMEVRLDEAFSEGMDIITVVLNPSKMLYRQLEDRGIYKYLLRNPHLTWAQNMNNESMFWNNLNSSLR